MAAMAPAAALVLCLLTTVFLSTPPPAIGRPSSASPPLPHPRPAAADADPTSSSYQLYIILLKARADAHMMDDGERRSWYASYLPDELTASGEPRIVRSYKTILDGFAAWLTEDELVAASKKPGFGRWFPERKMYPTTTYTPGFLGLTKDAGLWPDSHFGKGVVIGIIDYKHPSFNDTGMSPPPARWKGACKGGWWFGEGLNASVWHPLRYLGACSDLGAQTTVSGNIVISLYDNGAAQVVVIGQEKSGYTLIVRDYGASILQLPGAVGLVLKDYSRRWHITALVSFQGTQYAKDGDEGNLSLNCSSLPKVMDFNLNYPSIMEPANTTVQRTLTNVGPVDNWYATVAITDGSGVEPGEKLTFSISTEYRGKMFATEGVLIWDAVNSKRRIQSPLVVEVRRS
ncbi:subtilisin-like protease SBT1.2 [Panicum miliaceum]|uniref:Subtilisin-like protease SBT1.2 n=1 Tax=Panicum miliaceum TaxID=4540 RepID=A0A3L6SVH5_PANMI|nr:subtilisin-like protease SBT1.2 [Panicum miliaceum]